MKSVKGIRLALFRGITLLATCSLLVLPLVPGPQRAAQAAHDAPGGISKAATASGEEVPSLLCQQLGQLLGPTFNANALLAALPFASQQEALCPHWLWQSTESQRAEGDLLPSALREAFGRRQDVPAPDQDAAGRLLAEDTSPARLAQAGSGGGSTVTILGDDPPTLDPALTSDTSSHQYVVELFSGLVTLNPQLQIVPDLAELWRISPDGKTYTFYLRKAAKFHNDQEVTASDVKYSLERAADPKTNSPTAETYLGDIKGVKDKLAGKSQEIAGVRMLDKYTLQIELEAPRPYFLAKLTYPTSFVVDKENVESGRNWTNQPNGTGPFKLKQWVRGEQIVLERNPAFYLGPPALYQVRFLLAGGNALTLYRNNELDIAPVALSAVEGIQAPSNPLNKEFVVAPELHVRYVGFNTEAPPFDDRKVRQAFNLAVDKDRIIKVVLRDLYQRADGVIPPGMPGYNPGVEGLSFDPERARQLLQESTYGENLPPITLTISGTGVAVDPTTQALVDDWKTNLGVSVRIQRVPFATLISDVRRDPSKGKKNRYQMYGLGWSADYPDPQDFVDLLFHSQSLENNGAYSNPRVDALLDQARSESDQEQRFRLYQEAEQIIVDDAAWLPLYHEKTYRLVKPWVKGYTLAPMSVSTWRFVSVGTSFAPAPKSPADGALLPGLRAPLSWTNPPGTASNHLQLQRIQPGATIRPSLDTIREAAEDYVVEPPQIGKGNYVLLPGATYQWRVRATEKSGRELARAPSWGPWSPWSTFRTPAPASEGLAVEYPRDGETVSAGPKILHWSHSNQALFFWEIQVSRDQAFGQAGRIAPVWDNLVHGGRTAPVNSWKTPGLQPSTTYYWRVRPAVPPGGTPADWGPTWRFITTNPVQIPLPVGKIAYTSRGDGQADLYELTTTGARLRLTSEATDDILPAWSPDGAKLAYVTVHNTFGGNPTTDIYVMNADGSAKVRLTSTPGLYLLPTWSPDSTQVAFTNIRNAPRTRDVRAEIVVAKADGSSSRLLDPEPGLHILPFWSPDGAKIAYMALRDVAAEFKVDVYVINADGSGKARVNADDGVHLLPTWSPDGSKIAYMSLLRIGLSFISVKSEIRVASPDGGSSVTVAADPPLSLIPTFYLLPTWSPSGSTLAYTAITFGTAEAQSAINGVKPDGTGQARLSPAGPSLDLLPVWAPDGAKIAFMSLRDATSSEALKSDVYVMNADGSARTVLIADDAFNLLPVWSPDGSKITFTALEGISSGFEATSTIGMVSASGGGTVRLSYSGYDYSPVWTK